MVEKSERITVRFTPEAEQWIIKQADKAGVSKGRYVRKVALGELRQAEQPFRKKDQKIELGSEVRFSDLEKVLEHDLPKIGNNLNQLTRHVNEQSEIGIKQINLLKDIRKEISRIANEILTVLR